MSNSFQASGLGSAITASTGATLVPIVDGTGYQFRIVTGAGTNNAFVRFGDSSVVASSLNNGYHYQIPGGVIEVISVPEGLEAATHMSIVTDTGTLAVQYVRGKGL